MTTGCKVARTIPALLQNRAKTSPDAVAFAYERDADWREVSWRGFVQQVQTLAAALASQGLAGGSHVGILASTSLEWELVHHAVLWAGGVLVGLEPHDSAERLQSIAEHAELSMLVAGNAALLEKLSPVILARLKVVVLIDEEPVESSAFATVSLKALMRAAGSAEGAATQVSPDVAATLIYTSGTTGEPKGILYRHDQVAVAVHAIADAYPSLPAGARFVCWLPLSNLFQRVMNLAALVAGGTVYLVSNPLAVLKSLQTAKPDVFIGVPRFYEKLHSGMLQEIERKPPLSRNAIRGAIWIGNRMARAQREGAPVSAALRVAYATVERFILPKLRQVMGGRVRFMVTGSAPTPVRLLEFFEAMGLPLYEAYGLSENVVPMALNSPGESRFGTVGRPLPQNELRIDTDGELLVRGPGVFSGYYNDNRREELFTADGFYRTGDYAAIDPDGMLRLQGRKSEIIKTSSGRRLSPIQVEARLEESPLVDRAIVIGAGRKCLVAAISLDREFMPPEWNYLFESAGRDIRKQTADRLLEQFRARTDGLPQYLRPGGYLILRRPLSIESGELTSNLKLRRKRFEERYAEDLLTLYEAIGNENMDPALRLSVR